MLDKNEQFLRLLERKSLPSRKAYGKKLDTQSIVSNVDVAFILNSFDDDFNSNRIERYLVLAHQSSVDPLVVLTKPDVSNDLIEKWW